jgi:NAD(P)-dependent dehydrogenase (short-subunit alcohol dehydrogenase family)
MDRPSALITGNSSGLGRGLTEVLLDTGYRVYGCSRRGYGLPADLPDDLMDQICDLSRFDDIPPALEQLLAGVTRLDLVVLNAGILGDIREIHRTPMHEIQRIMDINTWANKAILDWLHQSSLQIDQMVLISSGAAVLGNKGWSGYALSKAALNMLGRLYSHEFPTTHISAIAPGLIDTAMMDYLCDEGDSASFPALRRIQEARGTEVMPGPRQAAERILTALPLLKGYESGSFVDIRQILAPEEYAALTKK